MKKVWFNGASIKFNPHDIWVGVYWKSSKQPDWSDWDAGGTRLILCKALEIYLCIIPMFPILLRFSWILKSMDFGGVYDV